MAFHKLPSMDHTATNHVTTPEDLYHNKTGDLMMFFCYRPNATTSAGIYLNNNPLDFSFPLLLYQVTVIFIAARLVHAVLRRLSVPLVISQIISGMLLGPSFLGRNKQFEMLFFKPQGWEQLNTIAYLSFTLFIFVIGIKTDIAMIPKSGKKAFAIAFVSTGLSHILLAIYVKFNAKNVPILFDSKYNIFTVGVRWSMSSYVVLSCALGELNLLSSKLGRIAMSAALVADFFNTFAAAFLTAILFGQVQNNTKTVFLSLVTFVCLIIFLVFVARHFVIWLIRQAPESRFLDETRLMIILMMALACALLTELVGYHTWGAFVFGLVIPGGAPLGVTVVERIDRFVSGVFMPVFVALAGLRMDLATIGVNFLRWKFFQSFVSISVAGKFLGAIFACLYFRMTLKEAMILALMMNFKGIREVDYTAQFQDNKTLDNQQYTILMGCVIFLGGVTAILVKYFYRPEDCFITYKKRTIHHSKPGDELRILSCIHSQSDVALTLSLLDASYPTDSTPICVYLIHLVEMAGRADTILRPYKQKSDRPRKINSTASNSDRIVNAFHTFERLRPTGAASIIPYVCISPYNTMHEDICSVALDKKAVIVLIPFHKKFNIDGTSEPPNPSILTLNKNVLAYAPCSVAILIDQGSTNESHHQVAMYFIGGPDDREALALAARMADNPVVGLTVVRFIESQERRLKSNRVLKDNDEERIDNEILDEFIKESVDDVRVIYREEVVNSGEELVGVIRETNGMFSLLIVGKRGDVKDHGKDSLMEGLSEWSEHPELGVIGDLLASADFGCMVSTLVVQQQQQAVVGNHEPQFDSRVVPIADGEV